ncbi:hypothetical protein QFZ98_007877 [Paraburkholderia youngii]
MPPARLPLQMKAQRQPVQMAKHFQRKLAHRAFRHFRKQHFAQLGEERRGQPHHCIRDHQQADAAEQHDAGRVLRAAERGQMADRRETVDDVLHHDRHAEVRDLRADQAAERDADSPFVGCKVWQQRQDRLPVVAGSGGNRRGF